MKRLKDSKIIAIVLALAVTAALIEGCPKKKEQKNMSTSEESHLEKATFAAGCFWGIEAAFSKINGVKSTTVGYTGGHLQNPTYEQVCSGKTGHAEAVQITYDPKIVSYEELVEVLWKIHDPTTPDRQRQDAGYQYRSAVFYHSEEQQLAAEQSKQKAQSRFTNPVVAEITPAPTFYKAEEYHQKYLEKKGQKSCTKP
jgi:peptide-methionine (S)-S-oxide reductase